jgi:hypothetical protein
VAGMTVELLCNEGLVLFGRLRGPCPPGGLAVPGVSGDEISQPSRSPDDMHSWSVRAGSVLGAGASRQSCVRIAGLFGLSG